MIGQSLTLLLLVTGLSSFAQANVRCELSAVASTSTPAVTSDVSSVVSLAERISAKMHLNPFSVRYDVAEFFNSLSAPLVKKSQDLQAYLSQEAGLGPSLTEISQTLDQAHGHQTVLRRILEPTRLQKLLGREEWKKSGAAEKIEELRRDIQTCAEHAMMCQVRSEPVIAKLRENVSHVLDLRLAIDHQILLIHTTMNTLAMIHVNTRDVADALNSANRAVAHLDLLKADLNNYLGMVDQAILSLPRSTTALENLKLFIEKPEPGPVSYSAKVLASEQEIRSRLADGWLTLEQEHEISAASQLTAITSIGHQALSISTVGALGRIKHWRATNEILRVLAFAELPEPVTALALENRNFARADLNLILRVFYQSGSSANKSAIVTALRHQPNEDNLKVLLRLVEDSPWNNVELGDLQFSDDAIPILKAACIRRYDASRAAQTTGFMESVYRGLVSTKTAASRRAQDEITDYMHEDGAKREANRRKWFAEQEEKSRKLELARKDRFF